MLPSTRSPRIQIIELEGLLPFRVVVAGLELPDDVSRRVVLSEAAKCAVYAAKSSDELRHTDRVITPKDSGTLTA